MITLKRFWYEHKYEMIITIFGVLVGVFATLGRDAAFCMWAPDSILMFCSEASRIIVGSLLFPLVMVICGVAFRDGRHKVLAIIYSKLVLEIALISIGVNINCFSPVFWGDLSALFFISVDAILSLSLLSEKVEKAVSGGVLIAVIAVSLFTVAINGETPLIQEYIFRVLYTCLIYLSVFLVLNDLSGNRICYSKLTGFKFRIKREKAIAKLVSVLFMVALSAALTLCFVIVSGHSNVLPIKEKTSEIICYISWCVLYLLVAAFIFISKFKTSMLKNLFFASCVASASTVTIMLLNSYGHLLEYNYCFGEEIKYRFYDFFKWDIAYTYSFGWLRYPAVFLTVFLVSLIVFIIISKRQNDDIRRIIGKIKASVYADDEEFNDFGDEISEFDFERKTISDNEWGSVFDGDTFAMDNKIYDVLLTFENEAETEKFIVYTDNSLDEDGKVQIFASKYMPEISVDKLIPIEDDEEWATIKRLLDYAMERVSQNTEKEKEGVESKKESRNNKQGEFDAFTTLCYMAKAIVQNEKNKVPFILTTKGEDENNDAYGVTMSGTAKELETLLKYTMMSIAKRYKSDGIRSSGVYDRFSEITVSAVGEVYKSKLREEIERMMSENKDDFDVNNYLEGD